ncbi:MAG: class IV adenylate cyclase [Treponema sp.]|jgi:adenylate cyclase class IV|nr:class IV adenylate cyclase [Treponema sp.]
MGKAIEIELKARPAGYEACRRRLEALAGGEKDFFKDDAYWFPAPSCGCSGVFRNREDLKLRIRREESGGERSILVTRKVKEKRGEIEVNDEREFSVSDGEVFEDLLTALGFEERIRKQKQGWSWNIEGITAELCEVSGFVLAERSPPPSAVNNLGWFLELEILSAGGDPAEIGAARKRLLDLLEKAGIDQDRIEERYYSAMLAERQPSYD